MSFRRRLMAILALLVLIPAVVLFAAYQIRSVNMELLNSLIFSVEQAAVIIQNELGEVRLLADSMCENPVLRGYMSADGAAQTMNEQIDEHRDLAEFVLAVSQSNSIYDIRLYFEHDKYYTAENITYFDAAAFAENRHFAGATVRGMFTGVYHQQYKDKNAADVLSYVRLVSDRDAVVRTVGALAADIRVDDIRAFLQQENARFSHLSIVDRSGRVIISDREFPDVSSVPEPVEGVIHGSGSTTVVYPIRNTEWFLAGEIVTGIPGRLFSYGASDFYFILAFCMIIAVVALAVLTLFARRIDTIVSTLDSSEGAEKQAGVFRHLTHSAKRAESLIVQQQRDYIERQQMRMRLLQAQINPHMLYNILDTTNWLINNGENREASRMVSGIARYYRLALSGGSDTISVEQDLELALIYAGLQEARLKRAIPMEYVLEEEARHCLIPKMTIQPLVENAIFHGLAGRLEEPRIDIDIYCRNQALIISISDNGDGFDVSRLPEILSGEGGGNGFGLYNVHTRAILFSGQDGYGVKAESEIGKYTTITLTIRQTP